jgi:type II secretory pathway predicted ATPase ExeA
MIHHKKLLALYGLKYHPFQPDIPREALWTQPGVDSFFFRIEDLVMQGGFAMIAGDSGLGKSKVLQQLTHRLGRLEDVVVGVMERPQSSVGDFYREMGALFGVNLSPANRYGGFKALRERRLAHIKTTLMRPVLLIDEAQEMFPACLNELRLLSSANFDSQSLLTTVLSGDMRLPERFQGTTLVSLGTRLRVRLNLEPLSRDQILDYIEHTLSEAGAPQLMSDQLKQTLADHTCGNLRLLNSMAEEMLVAAVIKEAPQLDEKLFIEIFSRRAPQTRKARTTQAGNRNAS